MKKSSLKMMYNEKKMSKRVSKRRLDEVFCGGKSCSENQVKEYFSMHFFTIASPTHAAEEAVKEEDLSRVLVIVCPIIRVQSHCLLLPSLLDSSSGLPFPFTLQGISSIQLARKFFHSLSKGFSPLTLRGISSTHFPSIPRSRVVLVAPLSGYL